MLSAFLYGLVFSLIATPIVRFFAAKRGVVDQPDAERKFHKKPTPLLGGLAVFAAFGLAVWCLRGELLGGFLLQKHLIGIALGGLFLVGVA